ncbi:hypothetical protein BKA56DRAFT_614877 [Ilyonectria sp. MPI-CAGE-AT-0026]|nr:hypothetical protein BKA56DRAFT_614877 [Ilyonectria sp. MPI-CAGE-AT-0026]
MVKRPPQRTVVAHGCSFGPGSPASRSKVWRVALPVYLSRPASGSGRRHTLVSATPAAYVSTVSHFSLVDHSFGRLDPQREIRNPTWGCSAAPGTLPRMNAAVGEGLHFKTNPPDNYLHVDSIILIWAAGVPASTPSRSERGPGHFPSGMTIPIQLVPRPRTLAGETKPHSLSRSLIQLKGWWSHQDRFPNFTPSVYWSTKKKQKAVIATIHP